MQWNQENTSISVTMQKQCKMDDLYVATILCNFSESEGEDSKEAIAKIIQEAKTLNPSPFYH